MSETYHYYFENKICRSIKGVNVVKVDTWIHLQTDNGLWLVNPDKVCAVRIETDDYEKTNDH